MDEKLFKKGLEKRKATLGKEYVEKNNSIPSVKIITKDGFQLGTWTNYQRRQWYLHLSK